MAENFVFLNVPIVFRLLDKKSVSSFVFTDLSVALCK